MASVGRGARNKGAAFERKIANKFTDKFGVEVRRTGAQERWKSTNGGDVNPRKGEQSVLNDFFFELKCQESWSLLPWYKKAVDDVGGMHQIPMVIATKNREDDYVFMKLDDMIRILKELNGYRYEQK
jgi:Holliday junction resolvase